MLVSGDRESEVRYLADQVGIKEVYAEQSPEDKVNIVRRETEKAKTLFLGDGINDAPALLAATVGLAFGTGNEITGDASRRGDHGHVAGTGRRIHAHQPPDAANRPAKRHRRHGGQLDRHGRSPPRATCTPSAGAILQEVIDILAVTNAVRAAWPPKSLTDF